MTGLSSLAPTVSARWKNASTSLTYRTSAGYRWPQFSIHRGQLLGVLHRAVRQRLGPTRVHPGQHLWRFGQQADHVWADFVDRASGVLRAHVEVDTLVGCDGIHSVLRQAFFPHEGPLQWNGMTMWRTVTEGAPFLSDRTMVLAGHVGRRLIVYPISRRHEAAGKARIIPLAPSLCHTRTGNGIMGHTGASWSQRNDATTRTTYSPAGRISFKGEFRVI